MHDGSVPNGNGQYDKRLRCANYDCPCFGMLKVEQKRWLDANKEIKNGESLR